ncbi:unnamed protein product [Closterium sp. NIES-53]
MRRMIAMHGVRESLNKDTPTSHIIKDEVMLEAKRHTELLPHTNYATLTKLGCQQGQRGKLSRGGSGGGKSAKDTNRTKSAMATVVDGGSVGSVVTSITSPSSVPTVRNPTTSTTREVAGGPTVAGRAKRNRHKKNRHRERTPSPHLAANLEAMRGVMLDGWCRGASTLAPEANDDFKAVAAIVQANLSLVLLNSGYSHHVMGTKEAYVGMQLGGDVSHVCGFNGALQVVQGHSTVALLGEAGKQVLVPDVIYAPSVRLRLHTWLAEGQRCEAARRQQRDAKVHWRRRGT